MNCRDYFFEQVAHLSQVEPESVQHFMPQLDLLEQQALLVQAQPVANAATHRDRARTLMNFIVLFLGFSGGEFRALLPQP